MYPVRYEIGKLFFTTWFKLSFQFKVYGHENVPKEGGAIVAFNHGSFFDPPIAGCSLKRRINFVARQDLFDKAWKRFFLEGLKAFPINRDRLDKAGLKKILDFLKNGELVGLFPEGTRSPDGELLPGKPGIGMIVSMAKVPVVPAYIKGSYKTLGKEHKKLKTTPISVYFGKPVTFDKIEGESSAERYQRVGDTIMAEIAKLKSEAE
ncbi:MAG TPA: lysophospholipid acyltransferase family protein [Nitrospirota bacterium]